MRLALVFLLIALPASAGEYAQADHPWDWQFPRDHGSHPEFKTEWWYFTGALEDAEGDEWGFELTFFRFALVPDLHEDASRWRARDLILAHFTVTDVAGGRFHFVEKLQRAAAGLAGAAVGELHVFAGDWEVRAEGDTWLLSAGDSGSHRAELRMVAERGPVLHGGNGLSWKREDRTHASHYYSIPRLRTEGALVVDGRRIEVTGTTWMDQEFFSGDTPVEGLGWDWFSCRLDDGRDLMLYLLRHSDGSRYRSGTLVEADGTSRPLDLDGLSLEPGETWTSPETGAVYPVQWTVVVPNEDLRLEVEALLDAQEVHARETVGFAYWEGLSRYRGEFAGKPVKGRGYVELTGYLPAESGTGDR